MTNATVLQQALSEALWRPTMPIIVLLRVPEPNLRSVWLSLRVLTAIVPHMDVQGFTARDIVELAGVTDSHIHRYLATLVERGVVCKASETDSRFSYPKASGREGKRPCVRYAIDLPHLERLSLAAYPDLIARFAKRYPRAKPIVANQPDLFSTENQDASTPDLWSIAYAPLERTPLDTNECGVTAPIGGREPELSAPTRGSGTIALAASTPNRGSQPELSVPNRGNEGVHPGASTPNRGSEPELSAPNRGNEGVHPGASTSNRGSEPELSATIGGSGTIAVAASAPNRGSKPQLSTPIGGSGTIAVAASTPNRGSESAASPLNRGNSDEHPVIAASNRGSEADVSTPIGGSADHDHNVLHLREEEERKSERAKNAPTRATTFVADRTHNQPCNAVYAPPADSMFDTHPLWIRSTPLMAHPRDIWKQAAGDKVRPTDEMVLTDLAGQLNGGTNGHGWYWLGRAILAASLLDAADLPYIRKMITRWREEDSYGSDSPKRPYTRRDTDGRPPARTERSGRSGAEAGNLRSSGRGTTTSKPFDGWQRD